MFAMSFRNNALSRTLLRGSARTVASQCHSLQKAIRWFRARLCLSIRSTFSCLWT